jgi:hypothetical protein
VIAAVVLSMFLACGAFGFLAVLAQMDAPGAANNGANAGVGGGGGGGAVNGGGGVKPAVNRGASLEGSWTYLVVNVQGTCVLRLFEDGSYSSAVEGPAGEQVIGRGRYTYFAEVLTLFPDGGLQQVYAIEHLGPGRVRATLTGGGGMIGNQLIMTRRGGAR